MKCRRRLEGLSTMEHKIKKAVTYNRINKKNMINKYLKMPKYLSLREDKKEEVKAAFVTY